MSDLRALLNAGQGSPQNLPHPVTRKRQSVHPESDTLPTKCLCLSPTEYPPSSDSPHPLMQHSAQFTSPLTQTYQECNPTIPPAPLPMQVEKADPVNRRVVSQVPSAAAPSAAAPSAAAPSTATLSFAKAPLSPVALTQGAGDRFARSRTVGQTHRDKERTQSVDMDVEVGELGRDHELLRSLMGDYLRDDNEEARLQDLRTVLARELRSGNPRVHPLSGRTRTVFSMSSVSGSLAVLMLELIAARRNLVAVYSADRRRRPTYQVPSAPSVVAHGLAHGRASIAAEADTVGVAKDVWVESCISGLSEMHENWSQHEYMNDHADVEDHLEKPEEAEEADGTEKQGRGKGPKRCSRCNKFKFAGSGHGRSKCDDHQLISSSTPYPAVPRT